MKGRGIGTARGRATIMRGKFAFISASNALAKVVMQRMV